MLFFFNVKINQPSDMPIERLNQIWHEEAKVALQVKEMEGG